MRAESTWNAYFTVGDQFRHVVCSYVCAYVHRTLSRSFGRVRPDTRDAAVVTLVFATSTDWNSAYADVGLFKAVPKHSVHQSVSVSSGFKQFHLYAKVTGEYIELVNETFCSLCYK